jgi:hypothetical protein
VIWSQSIKVKNTLVSSGVATRPLRHLLTLAVDTRKAVAMSFPVTPTAVKP